MKKLILIALVSIVFSLASCTSKDDSFKYESTITIYTRDTSSGTRDGFMNGIGFSEAAKSDSVLAPNFLIRDNTAIVNAMKIDEYGIGYISLSSLNEEVKGLKFNGVQPTEANVMNNTYELKRPFMWMTRQAGDYPSEKVEQLVNAFIAFLTTTDAQDIINNAGAIGLSATKTWDDIKSQYPITLEDNRGVTIRFGGSDSIQKVAEALTSAFKAKAGNFVAEHDHTGSSDGYKRTNDPSIKDTSVGKDVGFASRYFTESETKDVAETNRGQLAWDAIVAIVHKDNPINDVDAVILKNMYSGAFTTWQQVSDAIK